jgi:hypothetical protein
MTKRKNTDIHNVMMRPSQTDVNASTNVRLTYEVIHKYI